MLGLGRIKQTISTGLSTIRRVPRALQVVTQTDRAVMESPKRTKI